MVGGFLGAGKTTLLAAAAERLAQKGKRVGLVTNDQAANLVDTQWLEQRGFRVGEVSAGCFCCHFDELLESAETLEQDVQPDVLLCEPVGSCTDIASTVLQPLRRLYADRYQPGPLTVLLDPGRLAMLMGEDEPFPQTVQYILQTQLQEADVVLLTKADLHEPAKLEKMADRLREYIADVPVRPVSAETGAGLDEWLELIAEMPPGGGRTVEVDYDRYAEGEAVLGWLNAVVDLQAREERAWRDDALRLLTGMRDSFREEGAEAAHVKLLLETNGETLRCNLTSTSGEPAASGGEDARGRRGVLTLNARAHIAPEKLREVFEQALGRLDDVEHEVREITALSPTRPVPLHHYRADD
jgi:Ni2+-binding GTPase involved in maturation of urease and hydrogenase